jgi:hypothetical protein
MGVPMQIQVTEIRDRFVGPAGRDFMQTDETSQGLNDLDVNQVRRVEFVVIAEEA